MSMDNFQGYLEKYVFRQKQCLYPLLFQEYIYVFAYDYGLNGSLFCESVEELIGYDNKYSLVLVKRLIIRMYQQNYLINSVNHSKLNSFIENNYFFYFNFYSQMISESFGVILEIPFSLKFLSFLKKKKKKILKLQNLQSIHSIFSFLEDKLSHSFFVLDILIPYPIHFEILIQIIQCWIRDVSFLHLLRFFLFEYWNWNTFITSKNRVSIFSKENKRLFQFLYNSYIAEYEFVFLFLQNKGSYLRLTSFGIFLERVYFYGKIEHFLYLAFLQKNLWFFEDSFIHYVRYKSKAILSSRGTFLLMKKWKSYLIFFWQYYFHFWFQPNKIFINQLSNYSFYFFGYLLSVKKNHLVVRSQILENSILIDTVNNQLDIIIPVISLIRSLSIATFCTISGHPISKPIWTDLSDRDIINRFGLIYRNLFHYYSGSSKKRSLYQIKFILRLSCAKTLARKHKSTVRTFLQKLGVLFLEEFFTEEEKVLSLVFQKTIHFYLHRSNKERIWYLDIIRINDLVNQFELWS